VSNWHCILKGTYCTSTKGKNQKGCKEEQRYYPVIWPDGKTVMTEGLKEEIVLNIQKKRGEN
jgi:hypothetical protein